MPHPVVIHPPDEQPLRRGTSHAVRGHLRSGRPVRSYVREIVPTRLTVRLMPKGSNVHRILAETNDPNNVHMFVLKDQPETIYVAPGAKDLTAEETARVLSHETLHAALFRTGEDRASFNVDDRRRRVASGLRPTDVLEPNGLYRYTPRRTRPADR